MDRVITVVSAVTVTISGVTITGGARGGVDTSGTLTLDGDAVVRNHRTDPDVPPGTGGSATLGGGGITNTGSGRLTVVRSTVGQNTHTGGNGSAEAAPHVAATGETAIAGGIYNEGASLVVRDSTIIGNTAIGGDGGRGFTAVAGGGGDGQGGGLFLAGSGVATTVNSTVSGNTVRGGLRGIGPFGDGPLANALGGGIADASTGTVNLQNDTLARNRADTANGANADGGNLYDFGGATSVTINGTIIARARPRPRPLRRTAISLRPHPAEAAVTTWRTPSPAARTADWRPHSPTCSSRRAPPASHRFLLRMVAPQRRSRSSPAARLSALGARAPTR